LSQQKPNARLTFWKLKQPILLFQTSDIHIARQILLVWDWSLYILLIIVYPKKYPIQLWHPQILMLLFIFLFLSDENFPPLLNMLNFTFVGKYKLKILVFNIYAFLIFQKTFVLKCFYSHGLNFPKCNQISDVLFYSVGLLL
jgi:hypothetical protein